MRIDVRWAALTLSIAVSTALSMTLGNAAVNEPDAMRQAGTLLADGYYSRALALLEPLMKSTVVDSRLHYLHGSALLGIKNTAEALAETKAAVKADPTDGPLYRLLGEIDAVRTQAGSFLAKPGLATTTLKDFQTAVRLAPDDAESHLDLARYYINAPAIVGGGKARAEAEIPVLMRLNPAYAARIRAEVAMVDDEDFGAAEAALKRAVAVDSTPDSLLELGRLYSSNQRPKEALDTFRTMTARFPEAIIGWYQLGHCAALARTDYAIGINAMERYLAAKSRPDKAPPTGRADLQLAELFQLNGDPVSARRALANARTRPPADDAGFDDALDRIAATLQ